MGATTDEDDRAAYGILGVGSIAEAIVVGLCAERNDAPRIVLSPRGAQRARALADRFPTVTVAEDNAEVLAGAGTILVCVRPQDAGPVLEPLEFAADHVVVSVVAGVRLGELRPLLAPASDVVRAIPLPAVARRAGVTPITPASSAGRALFQELGGVIEPRDEEAFDGLSAASATIAAHYAYLRVIAAWLTRHGVTHEQAGRYVASMFAGAAIPLRADSVELAGLEAEHATPGGINERFRETLAEAGAWTAVTRSLDEILARLTADERAPGRP